MRWFIYILCLGNAAFLYTNVQAVRRAPPPDVAPLASHDSIKQLLLLGEVSITELRRRGEPDPDLQPSTEAQQDLVALTTPAAPLPQVDAKATPAPSSDAAASSSTVVELATGQASSPAAEDVVPADKPILAGPESAPTHNREVAAAPREQCFSVGPISEPEDAKAARAWLAKRSYKVELRDGKRRELSRYWVHLPRFANLASAREVHKKLSASGVKDLHVIARGNMANTLSLGVYSQRDSMERRVEKLRSLGEKPLVTERFKAVRAVWLDGKAASAAQFPTTEFRSAFDEMNMRVGRCSAGGKLLRASALPNAAREKKS
jgi:hypothetical protein